MTCQICGNDSASEQKTFMNGLPIGVVSCDECRAAVKRREVGVVKRPDGSLHITDGRTKEAPVSAYTSFLESKQHASVRSGFAPTYRPDFLYDFQSLLLDWSVRKGCAAIFADCGLGKTPMQLAWAQNIIEATNRPVLVLTPLAVSSQTIREADKFGLPAERSQDGKANGARIVVSNYERLHHFDPTQFAGVVCDESSILKNFDGVTRSAVTEFMRKMRYRLLCTATAAPNDYIELGTSSEAVGELGYTDMLTMFFTNDEGTIAPMAYASKWRFKPHAAHPFWQWLCSWARAIRKPSDLGCDDGRFQLPALTERVSVVEASRPADGRLFVSPARNLHEQRWERRVTLEERCLRVGELATSHNRPFVAWCHLNDEGDRLEQLIPGSVQVSGADADEAKVEKFDAFSSGQARVLITKPKIGGFGLNWQHCSDVSLFPSHSYEQYYQAIRRCWRFGQTRPVTVDVVSTEGEADVLGNLQRKSAAADQMFSEMIAAIHQAMTRQPVRASVGAVPLPAWVA